MSSTQIVIVDNNGKIYPNLAGVFLRVYRIACSNVHHTGRSQGVMYHGEQFYINQFEKK